MENINERCFLCGKFDYKGIIVNGERICRECEEKIDLEATLENYIKNEEFCFETENIDFSIEY